MFNKQKTIGIILSYVSMAISILIVLFYKPFLLKTIGSSEIGINSIAGSLISLISLLDFGFNQTLVRYISKCRALNDDDYQSRIIGLFIKIYSYIALIALVFGFLIINIYPNISKESLSYEEIIILKQVFSILLINLVFSFPLMIFTSIINAYERFVFYKLTSIITTILKYICTVIVLINGYRIVTITIISSIFSFITYICYLIYSFKKINIKISFKKIDEHTAKEILYYSFFIFLNVIIDFLYNNTDKLLLGSLVGTAAVTTYEFGIVFTSFFQELSSSISNFFFPEIVQLYDKNKDMKSISNVFNKVSETQLTLLLLFLSGYILFGKEFICLWIGSKYIDAYYIGLIIMLPSIIPLSQDIGISIVRTMNLHKYRSYMYLIIAIINVIISIPLSAKYGAVGAAIGTCIGTIFGQIIFMNIFYYKVIGIDIKGYWKLLIRNASVVMPLLAITALIKSNYQIKQWSVFIIYVVFYSLMYIITAYNFMYKRNKKHVYQKNN